MRPNVPFELIGDLEHISVIVVGTSIREIARLRRQYGPGRWHKCKGTAVVRLTDGTVCAAELHWYEAHGIGRREIKLKSMVKE